MFGCALGIIDYCACVLQDGLRDVRQADGVRRWNRGADGRGEGNYQQRAGESQDDGGHGAREDWVRR